MEYEVTADCAKPSLGYRVSHAAYGEARRREDSPLFEAWLVDDQLESERGQVKSITRPPLDPDLKRPTEGNRLNIQAGLAPRATTCTQHEQDRPST